MTDCVHMIPNVVGLVGVQLQPQVFAALIHQAGKFCQGVAMVIEMLHACRQAVDWSTGHAGYHEVLLCLGDVSEEG